MVQVPATIYQAVKPYATCPDAIWESIVYMESNFNPNAVGDNGSSYGLFQLHVGGGQGDTALNLIANENGLTGQDAITYLLQHPELQAQVGMISINDAWNQLKNSYNALDQSWWLQFCSISGHPGGSPQNGVTIAYVQNFMRKVVQPNLFGIQQLQAGAGPNSTTQQDNTWLQALINMPPHQPCSVIWRRTCAGAIAANEGGMDLPSPNGTKVYALGAGFVIGAGYFWHPNGNPGYGVVTIRTTLPDGTIADIYYQHIQISPSIVLCSQTGGQLYNNVTGPAATNQPIQQGQFLGTVVVGEVEVGINAQWDGVWGTNHPGAWVDDPEDTIRLLMQNGGGSSNNTLSFNTGNDKIDAYIAQAFEQTQTAAQTLIQVPGIGGPIQVFDNAQQFKPFAVPDDNSSSANWPIWGGIEQGASYPTRLMMGIVSFLLNNAMAFLIRSFFIILAFIIIIALIINIMSKVTSDVSSEAGELAPLAEMAL